MSASLVPAFDAAGLPGPPWLFHVLLALTFFLHLLFLNLALGGTLLAAVSHLVAGGRGDDPRGALARRLMAVNTYAISLTITTGVAPLLFIQVIYQPFFYTATILIGSVWLGFVIMLTLGYYAAYLYKFRGAPARGAGGGPWLVLAAVMFLLVAVVHVTVHLIHAQPGLWGELVTAPWTILADPTYLPRLLHFVVAAVGFAALVATWWAVREARAGREVGRNTAIAAFSWKWVLWATAAQIVDGVVLLVVLPRGVLLGLMRGGAATMVPFTVALILAIGLLVMLARVGEPVASSGTVTVTLAAMVAVIAVMAVTRHQVRELYLERAMADLRPEIAAQWFNVALFTVLLTLGLATVAVMVRRVSARPGERAEAA